MDSNKSMKERLLDLGLGIPQIFLPTGDVDFTKWAVIACDQYTSDREYWHDVESFVGNSPSTRHMIFPEVYLDEAGQSKTGESINRTMVEYLEGDVIRPLSPGYVYIERSTPHVKRRKGLVLSLDLEQYDYKKGSGSLIRPTEATVMDRLPPRVAVRQNAVLDLPHILVLIDDPKDSLLGPLSKEVTEEDVLYDFDLMKGGGHIKGWKVEKDHLFGLIVQALEGLKEKNPLLYAIGDGNHSLASAKQVWEDLKMKGARPDHPARFALVEIENIHDPGLIFEPIHRILFDTPLDHFLVFLKKMEGVTIKAHKDFEEMKDELAKEGTMGILGDSRVYSLYLPGNPDELVAERLHKHIDPWLSSHSISIDYIHGDDAFANLSRKGGNLGIYLPVLDKKDFFRFVGLKGVMPRKTFSLGEAEEKRYYLESALLRD